MWPIFLFITRSKHFLQKTSCFQNFCNEFQIFNTELYPVKRLKGSFLRKYLTAFSRAKSSILDVLKVSECLSTVIMLLLENQIFIWEAVNHGMYRSKFVYMTNQYPNAKLTVWENTLPVNIVLRNSIFHFEFPKMHLLNKLRLALLAYDFPAMWHQNLSFLRTFFANVLPTDRSMDSSCAYFRPICRLIIRNVPLSFFWRQKLNYSMIVTGLELAAT